MSYGHTVTVFDMGSFDPWLFSDATAIWYIRYFVGQRPMYVDTDYGHPMKE